MLHILILGSNGFLGTALKNEIESKKLNEQYKFYFYVREDVDLLNTDYYFKYGQYPREDFDIIINLAAKCGGLYSNMEENYDYFVINNLINQSVMRLVTFHKPKLLINILSTCIFPAENITYPLTSDQILNGPPHSSNEGYSYAKRNMYITTKLFAESFKTTKFLNLIPTNLYGDGDKSTHVFPELIRKCKKAVQDNSDFVIKGKGLAKRQFLYINDLANVILQMMVLPLPRFESIIVSPPVSHEISIQDLVYKIVQKESFKGNIIFDERYSEGQLLKRTDDSELRKYLPNFTFTDFYSKNVKLF